MTPKQLNAITKSVIADLDSALVPLIEKYKRLIKRNGRKMARSYKAQAHSLTAAQLPPDEDEVIPDNLHDQVQNLTDAERREMVKLLIAAYEAHEIAFDVAPRITPELLEKVGAHASFATEADLRDIYRGVIERATLEGLSVPHTAQAIVSQVDGVAAYRATALARTDLIGLANGASMGIATEAFAGREDVTKVWLATDDERTRETHADADGQEVGLQDFFDVGGYPAMYPGDPDLPDEEVINCRCTVIYSGGDGGEQEAEVASSVLPVAYPAAMTPDAATAAVTITVDDTAAPDASERARTPWEGILAIEGHPTSDRRYLIPGEIGHRDLPLPFASSHEAQHSTETVGRIDSLEWIPAAEFAKDGWELPEGLGERAVVIWAQGSFDGSDDAADAIRQLENGVGVSLDLPIERRALIHGETFEEVDPSTLPPEDLFAMALGGGVPDGYLAGIGGKIGGFSLASIAAFEETTIRIVENHAIVASGFEIRQTHNPHFEVVITPEDVLTAGAIGGDDLRTSVEAPLQPPRDWFFRDEPDEPTPITILPTGEFFGHLALWNTCHAGKANGAYSACMYAPHSRTNYSQFHLGAILCDDGSEVPVGRITIGTGHAPLHLNAAKARAHYDNSGTCVAFARAKDGVFGIWLSGVIKSDATPEQIRDFRACPPSGDWRSYDHALELQAALAVNAPGFPVARGQLAMAASADSMEITTMVLGPVTEEDRAEALRAEYDLKIAEDVDMLVELGVGEFCGIELSALNRVDFRDYSAEQRRAMARSGEALPDGSFPIANCTDARNAISAQGRGSAPQTRVVSHIRKRVGALGCSGSIFDPYK